MRLPAYLLLPIVGAVVLIAAVLGTWLWPEPAVPSPSPAPPVLPAPVAMEPPPPPPSSAALQPKPLIRPAPTRPAEPPPQPVAEPVVVAQPEPPPPPPEPPAGPTTSPRMMDWSPEKQAEVKRNWATLRERSVELSMMALRDLERQRDEARARGEQAEADRLDKLIHARREQVEQMRQAQQSTIPGPAAPAPEAQAGSPLQ